MTKILVVDDSVSVRDVVERALASDETQVVSAASGTEAIEQIEREHPDLVVCDVRMPDRDGYEICRFVKSHPELGRTPVLLISGTVNSTVLAEAARVRSDDVLGKPFHMNELLRRVNDLLGSELEPERGSAAGRLRGGPAVELSAALTQLGTLPGVSWAALADPEGFLIDSVGEPGPLAETSAALVSWLGESCASIGRELGRGALHGVAVEYGHGTLFLQSVGVSATLIVLVDGPDSLGEVRHWARKMLPELGRGTARPC